jgi:hypothetical protein
MKTIHRSKILEAMQIGTSTILKHQTPKYPILEVNPAMTQANSHDNSLPPKQ